MLAKTEPSQWRYRNLDPDVLENAIRNYGNKKAAVDLRFEPPFPNGRKLSQNTEGYSVLFGMLYGYGYPLDECIKILEWEADAQDYIIPRCLADPTFVTLEDLGLSLLDFGPIRAVNPLLNAILIDRADLKERALQLLRSVIELGLQDESYFTQERADAENFIELRLAEAIVSGTQTDLLAQLGEDSVFELSGFTAGKIWQTIALGDSEGFNEAVRERLLKIFGSAKSRPRKKNLVPGRAFSIEMIRLVALALDLGMTFSIEDTAIPILDFPIAQRPEIRERILF